MIVVAETSDEYSLGLLFVLSDNSQNITEVNIEWKVVKDFGQDISDYN